MAPAVAGLPVPVDVDDSEEDPEDADEVEGAQAGGHQVSYRPASMSGRPSARFT